jgi:hypothetical protein
VIIMKARDYYMDPRFPSDEWVAIKEILGRDAGCRVVAGSEDEAAKLAEQKFQELEAPTSKESGE